MFKKIIVALTLLITSVKLSAQFGLYASAAFMNISGSNSFYNNTMPGLGQNIGIATFQGTNFGAFEQNSGNLKLIGAEIKTFKGGSDNVCSGTLNYTVYITGSRPASPIFSAINLGFYSDCFAPACGAFFGSYNIGAGGGCCSPGDQKWQNPGSGSAANIDLTTYTPGNYTLEIYYSYTGQDGGGGCGTTKYDNNSSNPANYTANFTITIPVPVKFGSVYVVNSGAYNTIYWNTYSEAYSSIFKLERSADGIHYNTIHELLAAGFSSTVKYYQLTDEKPLNDINYYRIKMMEVDNKHQYSAVIRANNKWQHNWYVSNNPVKQTLQLMGVEKADNITLFSASGARVFNTIAAGNAVTINTSRLATGTYLLKITGNKGTNVQQVMIYR
jgi:Secretion system C-terminal sorting domain